MNLTQAVIVFVLVAIVVIAAFCFSAWYFDRKNRYRYESTLAEEMDPALALKQALPFEQSPLKNQEKAIEMQLLNTRTPVNFARMSERAADSQRLSFMSSNTPNQSIGRLSAIRGGLGDEPHGTKDRSDLRHTYISKLARYTREGIELYDRDVKFIRNSKVFRDMNWVDNVKERAEMSKAFYPANSPNIDEIIDLLRFEECDYDKGVKWLVDIEVKNAEVDRDYKVDDLPKREYFEFITEAEYFQEVNKLSQADQA